MNEKINIVEKLLGDENFSVNMRDTTQYEDVISDLLNEINETQNKINSFKIDEVSIDGLVPKVFFKTFFKDITGIEVIDDRDTDKKNTRIYFQNGIDLIFKGAYTREDIDFYEDIIPYTLLSKLIEAGQIKLTTSPFFISIDSRLLTANYFYNMDYLVANRLNKKRRESIPLSPEEINFINKIFNRTGIFHPESMLTPTKNPHDNGVNCWGGYGVQVRINMNKGSLEDGLMEIVSRMREINLKDYGRDVRRIGELLFGSYIFKSDVIELDISVLANILISMDFNIISNHTTLYETQNLRMSLYPLMGIKEKENDPYRLYLFGFPTNIFIDDLEKEIIRIRRGVNIKNE